MAGILIGHVEYGLINHHTLSNGGREYACNKSAKNIKACAHTGKLPLCCTVATQSCHGDRI